MTPTLIVAALAAVPADAPIAPSPASSASAVTSAASLVHRFIAPPVGRLRADLRPDSGVLYAQWRMEVKGSCERDAGDVPGSDPGGRRPLSAARPPRARRRAARRRAGRSR